MCFVRGRGQHVVHARGGRELQHVVGGHDHADGDPAGQHRLGQPPRLAADEQPDREGGGQEQQDRVRGEAEDREQHLGQAPAGQHDVELGPARGGPGQQAEPGQQDDLDAAR